LLCIRTPTLINVKGKKQLISPASGAVFSYDPMSGEELWNVTYRGWSVIPKPILYKDIVFVGTGYERSTLLGIRVDGDSKGDVTDSHVEWEITKRAPHTPSVLIVDDLLYFISYDRRSDMAGARCGADVCFSRPFEWADLFSG
jgi:outer membrane protein assembly factor BamB